MRKKGWLFYECFFDVLLICLSRRVLRFVRVFGSGLPRTMWRIEGKLRQGPPQIVHVSYIFYLDLGFFWYFDYRLCNLVAAGDLPPPLRIFRSHAHFNERIIIFFLFASYLFELLEDDYRVAFSRRIRRCHRV